MEGTRYPATMVSARQGKKRAFTLVEVIITALLVLFMSVSIMGALAFGAYQKQAIRERNGAIRVAADLMESVKRTNFALLEAQTFDSVVIDDRGTETDGDNVVGVVTLRFFDENDNEVGTAASPMPLDLSMVRVEVTVSWNPVGFRSRTTETERLVTLLAP